MTKEQEETWANRIGKRKRQELIVDSRAESLSDEQRACISQTIMLGEAILDPARPNVTVLKSKFFALDVSAFF